MNKLSIMWLINSVFVYLSVYHIAPALSNIEPSLSMIDIMFISYVIVWAGHTTEQNKKG